jgi:2-polyprenyl-3-methyl-5-hydroxy-6-metoxy-1,4-benzoquinol methylase
VGDFKEGSTLAKDEDAKWIMELANIGNKTVLEIGCGNGRITFAIADKAAEIIAVDIDAEVIEEAQRGNQFSNVTFHVGDIETIQFGKQFDVVLSTWMGYMFLNDVPKAISNIASHLKDDGVFLLCGGSPVDEYNSIINMLVEENIKSIAFYQKLEEYLSNHFTFEKHILEEYDTFSNLDEAVKQFRLDLQTEYGTVMNKHHVSKLKDYLKSKENLTIGLDSLTYLCKKK